MEIQGLRYEGETTWDNVWQIWLETEGVRQEWQRVAREKGWQSWEEWRSAWTENFGAQKRRWLRYTILNPIQTVPNFRVGPTQSWQKNFPENERNKHTFATLIDRVSYEQNGKVRAILKDFPESTEFIGLYMPDKTIVNVEGHHRAAALAIAARQKRAFLFTQLPTIALTIIKKDKKNLLDIILARGSTKQRLK